MEQNTSQPEKRPVGRQRKGNEPRIGKTVSTTETTMAAVRRHFEDPHEALTLAVKYFKEIRELEKSGIKGKKVDAESKKEQAK